jgi:hypothetical protein
MRVWRTGVVALLVIGLSTSAFAGDLGASIAKAVEQEAQRAQPERTSQTLIWTGSAMFVGGMVVGIYGFVKGSNGEFSQFGEADATNPKLGTAGLITAFAGGVLMFLGSHKSTKAPDVTIGAGQVKVFKQISW